MTTRLLGLCSRFSATGPTVEPMSASDPRETSTDAAIVGRVFRDTEVIVLERDGDWLKVVASSGGKDEGWIHASLLGPVPASR